jgi:hypothetical protein
MGRKKIEGYRTAAPVLRWTGWHRDEKQRRNIVVIRKRMGIYMMQMNLSKKYRLSPRRNILEIRANHKKVWISYR